MPAWANLLNWRSWWQPEMTSTKKMHQKMSNPRMNYSKTSLVPAPRGNHQCSFGCGWNHDQLPDGWQQTYQVRFDHFLGAKPNWSCCEACEVHINNWFGASNQVLQSEEAIVICGKAWKRKANAESNGKHLNVHLCILQYPKAILGYAFFNM